VLFDDAYPIRALLIFCGPTQNALRRPWQAIQPLDCPLCPAAMAALGRFIGQLRVEGV